MNWWLHAPSEVFWVLIPFDALVLVLWLQVIPYPRMPQQPRWQKIAMTCTLIAFPVLFYGGLVWLCDAPMSWRELLIVSYFFVFCLELPLVYGFGAMETFLDWLKPKYGQRQFVLVQGVTKTCFYLMLVPCLLSVFAIHRPKLLPREFEFVNDSLVESISFPSREAHPLQLKGELLKHPRPQGTVIICHGVGANRSDISLMVEEVYRAGFHCLTFDFRGHGESDGHTITYGYRERCDILGAYDYCLQRTDLNAPLYALGVSMGGSSLLLALPEMPKVKAAIVDSAFADLNAMVDHQLRFFPSAIRYPLNRVAATVAWLETGANVDAIRPIDALAHIDCPVTLIHGAEDLIVPVSHGQQMSLLGMTYHEQPNAGHIGTAVVNPIAYRQLIRDSFTFD